MDRKKKETVVAEFYDGFIKLERIGKARYQVTYGKQVDTGLNYVQAAKSLGLSIMHNLQCEGKLDEN